MVVFEYEPTMLHSKTVVVDGIFSVFGSSNFDSRSAQINEELDITVYDDSFGAEMDAVFQRDLKKAKPYLLEDFKKRSKTLVAEMPSVERIGTDASMSAMPEPADRGHGANDHAGSGSRRSRSGLREAHDVGRNLGKLLTTFASLIPAGAVAVGDLVDFDRVRSIFNDPGRLLFSWFHPPTRDEGLVHCTKKVTGGEGEVGQRKKDQHRMKPDGY